MWFVFFAAVFLLTACSLIYIKNFKNGLAGNKKLFAFGMTLVLVLVGIADAIMNFGEFRGAFSMIGFAAALEFVLYTLLRGGSYRTIAFMAKAILAAVLLELTFFQLPSYRIITGNYEHSVLSLSQAEFTGCAYDESLGGIVVNGTSEAALEFHQLGQKIGTVYVDAVFPEGGMGQVNFFADMTEETAYHYRLKIIESALVSNSVPSQYATVNLSGETNDARFRFSGTGENVSCVIKGIELNKPVPFDVIPLRAVLLFLIPTFVYACIYSSLMNQTYEKNKFFCRTASVCITVLAVFIVAMLVFAQAPELKLADRFSLTKGDQITEELVLAFENGQFNLLSEPSAELLAMENPYDYGARYYSGIECLWDHALYNGKYYSYYGIAPLLLFLPYHLITGYFFPTDIAVLLFGSLGVIFLSMLYSAIVKKWFASISTGAYISGLAIILAGCGIWCSAGRTMFYELAISAGFLCFTAAAYFFVTSGILESGKTEQPRIFLSSLLMGLAVMSRPTLAVYAVCFCVFCLIGVVKREKGRRIRHLLCALAPLCALGLFQMYYNYARFGSVFEFGIKYSLTINDFTKTEFHLHNMLIGLYNFLIAPPAFIPDYPFISAPFSFLGINGYYYKDEGAMSGLIFIAPVVLGYFFGARALKSPDNKKSRVSAAIIVGSFGIIAPILIICSAWESGYSARYIADFSWQMIAGALIVVFGLYIKSENAQKKRAYTAAMGICCVYTVIVTAVETAVFAFPMNVFPEYADLLNRLVAFYK